jgi:hypothetical protein
MWPLPVVRPSEYGSLGLMFRQGYEEFSARITRVTLPARPAAVFYCGALGLFAFCLLPGNPCPQFYTVAECSGPAGLRSSRWWPRTASRRWPPLRGSPVRCCCCPFRSACWHAQPVGHPDQPAVQRSRHARRAVPVLAAGTDRRPARPGAHRRGPRRIGHPRRAAAQPTGLRPGGRRGPGPAR